MNFMIMTATKNRGPATKPVQRDVPTRRSVALFAVALLWAGNAWAENVLEKSATAHCPGAKVELTLKLAGSPPEPIAVHDGYAAAYRPRPRRHAQRNLGSPHRHQRWCDYRRVRGRSRRSNPRRDRPGTAVELRDPRRRHQPDRDGRERGFGATTTAMVGNDPPVVAAGGTEVSNVDFRRGKRTARAASSSRSAAKVRRPTSSAKATKSCWICTTPICLPIWPSAWMCSDFATPVQFIETRSRGNGATWKFRSKPPFEQFGLPDRQRVRHRGRTEAR